MGLGDKSKDIEDSSAGGHGSPMRKEPKATQLLFHMKTCVRHIFFVALLGSLLEGHEKQRNRECPTNPISLDTKGRETNYPGGQRGERKIGKE